MAETKKCTVYTIVREEPGNMRHTISLTPIDESRLEACQRVERAILEIPATWTPNTTDTDGCGPHAWAEGDLAIDFVRARHGLAYIAVEAQDHNSQIAACRVVG